MHNIDAANLLNKLVEFNISCGCWVLTMLSLVLVVTSTNESSVWMCLCISVCGWVWDVTESYKYHVYTHALFRYGSATFLTADDGDGDLYNASVSLEGRQLLEVDRKAGMVVGGVPRQGEDSGTSASQRDFHDGESFSCTSIYIFITFPNHVSHSEWGKVLLCVRVPFFRAGFFSALPIYDTDIFAKCLVFFPLIFHKMFPSNRVAVIPSAFRV